jgi:hypothetical protein
MVVPRRTGHDQLNLLMLIEKIGVDDRFDKDRKNLDINFDVF